MDGGPPVFPPGFTCPAVLWIPAASRHFRLRDSHLLWSAFPRRSTRWSGHDAGPNPRDQRPLVWPPPRSLATTCGISVDVFSCPYLDVSVQGVPRVLLFDSKHADTVLPCRVSPFGNLRIEAYLRLPEAYRSLSRPSSAPDAKAFPLRSFLLDLVVEVSLNAIQTKEWSNSLVLFRFELCRLICFTNKIVITHFVEACFVSFAAEQAHRLIHSAASPLDFEPAFAGLQNRKV